MRLLGIDISHWDPNVKWDTAMAGGVHYAFIKATEGVNRVDPAFNRFWMQAAQAGIIKGAYHYFHPDLDPVAQANFFYQTVGALAPTDLPPVIDWETGNLDDSSIEAAQAFLNAV